MSEPTEQQVDAAYDAFLSALSEMISCSSCNGRGYRYIGFDPDYCNDCGGNGEVPVRGERDAMRIVLRSILSEKVKEKDSHLTPPRER